MEDIRTTSAAPDLGVPEALQVPTHPVGPGFMLASSLCDQSRRYDNEIGLPAIPMITMGEEEGTRKS